MLQIRSAILDRIVISDTCNPQSTPVAGVVLPHRCHLDRKADRHLWRPVPPHTARHAFRSQKRKLAILIQLYDGDYRLLSILNETRH